jgi:hypothetical protein
MIAVWPARMLDDGDGKRRSHCTSLEQVCYTANPHHIWLQEANVTVLFSLRNPYLLYLLSLGGELETILVLSSSKLDIWMCSLELLEAIETFRGQTFNPPIYLQILAIGRRDELRQENIAPHWYICWKIVFVSCDWGQ